MNKCRQHWMLTTPILRLLLAASLPIVPAIFLLNAFDLLETSLIARLCTSQLTALGYSTPLTTAMTGIAIALSIASNSWICRVKAGINAHGPASEKNELNNSLIRALILSTSVTLVLAILLFWLSPGFYLLLGAKTTPEPELISGIQPLVTEYSQIRLMGWVPLVLIWQVNGMLRSLGHIKQASFLLIAWMLTKSALSYILIGNGQYPLLFTTGLLGAGYAHLISDTLFALLSLLTILRGLGIQKHQASSIQWANTFRQMSVTGLNACLQQLYLPISIGLLTFYFAGLAEDKVALLGIIFRIEALALLVPMVFTASLPGLIAANWWEGNMGRVKGLVVKGFAIIVLIQALVAVMLYFNPLSVASSITQDPNLLEEVQHYLLFVPISFIGAGCSMVALSCLNAIGKSANASILGFSHRLVLTLVFAMLGGWFASVPGVFIGIASAHFLSLALVFKYFIRVIWHNNPKIAPVLGDKGHIKLELS